MSFVVVLAVVAILEVSFPYVLRQILLPFIKPNLKEEEKRFAKLIGELEELKKMWVKAHNKNMLEEVEKTEKKLSLLQQKRRSQFYINNWLENKLLDLSDIW